jgi:hypothetical protein
MQVTATYVQTWLFVDRVEANLCAMCNARRNHGLGEQIRVLEPHHVGTCDSPAHSEPYPVSYASSVDWTAVHNAMLALDAARSSAESRMQVIGYDGIADALGGTYYGPHFETRGLAGLVALSSALSSITSAAWHVIHAAKEHCRYGQIRSAVNVMLAARDVYDLLCAAGVREAMPHDIASGHDGKHLLCTGLRWLAGDRTDNGGVTLAQARAFIDGAPAAIFAAGESVVG